MVVDNPPPYDDATAGSSAKSPPQPAQHPQQQPAYTQAPPEPPKQPPFPAPSPYAAPYRDHDLHDGGVTTHHYVNRVTGAHVVTYLPPDHPEMICLQQGEHVRRTRFGLLGVLAAVFFFPLGVALCLIDRRVKCDRCGRVLEDGVSCG